MGFPEIMARLFPGKRVEPQRDGITPAIFMFKSSLVYRLKNYEIAAGKKTVNKMRIDNTHLIPLSGYG
jgi:hypothetical protein